MAHGESIKGRVLLKEGRITVGIHDQASWGFKTNDCLKKRKADGAIAKIMSKYGFTSAETVPERVTARSLCRVFTAEGINCEFLSSSGRNIRRL
uniref:hypothetical protein n=1 Tax=Cupriavidus taiwanensis TaxID=164546 RepID=UPI00133170F8|nr:hypothetical protein [Cupriavidus taiwanensis]